MKMLMTVQLLLVGEPFEGPKRTLICDDIGLPGDDVDDYVDNKTIKDGDISPRPLYHDCPTAPRNNLTKETDENIAIGWISHIGRIVRRMLPVTPDFAPKAQRPWLH